MAVNKIKLANKKYKHEAKRKAKKFKDKKVKLENDRSASIAKKRRLEELEYVENLKRGLLNGKAED